MEEKILLALGSPDDVPEEILERIHKWAFMWMHEHGFEGETGQGVVQDRECYFIAIDKPKHWKKVHVMRLLESFGHSLSNYLDNNI